MPTTNSGARQWFRFEAKADQPNAELYIYGNIGRSYWDDDAVSAKQVMDELKELPASVKALTVRVNSLGGDAFAGLAIANALRQWGRADEGRSVTTVIEGIAASAASVVVMAGGTIRIADNALLMIHCAWTYTSGDASALRKMAESLDKIDAGLIATYKWHSSLSDAEIRTLLENETWMTADEAIAKGFATEKVEGLQAAASLDPRAAADLKVPPQFKAHVDALLAKPAAAPAEEKPVAASPKEVLRVCQEADCLDLAVTLVDAGATLADVQARVDAAKAERQQSAARAQAIRAACTAVKRDDLADGYVSSGMPLDGVKAHLAIITALIDRAEIDTNLAPGTKAAAQVDVAAIYAQRNRQTN